jgi:hypothetical protein
MRVPSVGPFELTEKEFIGLEFLRQDDERQLRKTTLRATWCGRELRVRAEGLATIIADFKGEIASRALPY